MLLQKRLFHGEWLSHSVCLLLFLSCQSSSNTSRQYHLVFVPSAFQLYRSGCKGAQCVHAVQNAHYVISSAARFRESNLTDKVELTAKAY